MKGDGVRPPWLVKRMPADRNTDEVSRLMAGLELNTICHSASCPNMAECYGARTATFLILGGVCTRSCRFCAVPKGRGTPLDASEPARLARAVAALGLKHVVITSVTRDDLPDGGAKHFARCIDAVRKTAPGAAIEVLTPDFAGNEAALATVLSNNPDVFNHNIETVPRLYSLVRPGADYRRSLRLMAAAARAGIRLVKSGIMVGLGEAEVEIGRVLDDLAGCGVNAVTIGQYLQPSPRHLPVQEYVHPDKFEAYRRLALKAGLRYVAAGPFVRSSYHAGAMLAEAGSGLDQEGLL